MDSQKAAKIAKQIKQDSLENLSENNNSFYPESRENDNNFQENDNNREKEFKKGLEEAKQKDLVWSQNQINQINNKIKEYGNLRQQQIEERRQPKETEAKDIEQNAPIVNSKPSRKGFWGRRIKSAQQQAQPETAARRSSG